MERRRLRWCARWPIAAISPGDQRLDIAAEIVARPNIRLVVVGGNARHASYDWSGPLQAIIARYHLDIAFVGTDGSTVTDGRTTHDEMEAQTELAFIRRAKRTIVIADSSKIGKVNSPRSAGRMPSTRW